MYAVVIHAHQKLDRVAYRHLLKVLPKSAIFPTLKQILHFEGQNGPDSTKLKKQAFSPQPWHFIDPNDDSDVQLINQINNHYSELVKFLKSKDMVRAAFESAWMAHALVDGLTPAHHYPYEKEMVEILGDSRESRKGIMGRGLIKGDNIGQTITKSLQMIGPKGLLTNHAMFEAGAYAIIAPLKLRSAMPTPEDLAKVKSVGVAKVFEDIMKEISGFDLYGSFVEKGWNRALSQDIKTLLAPRMSKMITLSWYAAAVEASAEKK
jgi:hypothetical protein